MSIQVIVIVYNWQIIDAIGRLVFSAVSQMWNSIRYVNNNRQSFSIYLHFSRENSDLDQIQTNMSLINIIINDTIIL